MSELLEQAARKVANAWTVPGARPVDHAQEKTKLAVTWPVLYAAVSELADLLDDSWEYNVEEYDLERGTRNPVSMMWSGDYDSKLHLMKTLDSYQQVNIDYGGKRVKEYKIIKRHKPEGYVDA